MAHAPMASPGAFHPHHHHTHSHTPGFVRNMVHGLNRLEQRATGKRKKFEAQKLAPGEDIFHNFQFSQPKASEGKTAGRKPYDWTPSRSRELIKLIIHSNLKFDDISAAMKDEKGMGPSETTCRNHWHDIFGYSPDLARLKNREGRDRRLKEHVQAYKAYQKRQESFKATTVEAERRNERSSRSSKAGSSIHSSHADSVLQSDDEQQHAALYSDSHASAIRQQLTLPDFILTGPDPYISHEDQPLSHPTDLPGMLRTVMEDEHNNTPRPASLSPAPSEISPEDTDATLPNPPTPPITNQEITKIEEKEGLPRGFITWFRKASLNSSGGTDSRHASSASRPSTTIRYSRSHHGSAATDLFRDYVPENAICTFLRSKRPTDDISASDIEQLMHRGASVNARTEKGETPLHLAVALGAVVACTILLDNHADPEAKTDAGESIWKYARKVSRSTLDPNGDYDKKEQLLRTMVVAHIEFLKATAKYNPRLIIEEQTSKRRRASDSQRPPRGGGAYSRSGAVGSPATNKKSRLSSVARSSSISPSPGLANLAPSLASPRVSGDESYSSRRPAQVQTIDVSSYSNPGFTSTSRPETNLTEVPILRRDSSALSQHAEQAFTSPSSDFGLDDRSMPRTGTNSARVSYLENAQQVRRPVPGSFNPEYISARHLWNVHEHLEPPTATGFLQPNVHSTTYVQPDQPSLAPQHPFKIHNDNVMATQPMVYPASIGLAEDNIALQNLQEFDMNPKQHAGSLHSHSPEMMVSPGQSPTNVPQSQEFGISSSGMRDLMSMGHHITSDPVFSAFGPIAPGLQPTYGPEICGSQYLAICDTLYNGDDGHIWSSFSEIPNWNSIHYGV